MSLVTCRFNPQHKCKASRIEIHEMKCPNRYYVPPEDMIPNNLTRPSRKPTKEELQEEIEIKRQINEYIYNTNNIPNQQPEVKKKNHRKKKKKNCCPQSLLSQNNNNQQEIFSNNDVSSISGYSEVYKNESINEIPFSNIDEQEEEISTNSKQPPFYNINDDYYNARHFGDNHSNSNLYDSISESHKQQLPRNNNLKNKEIINDINLYDPKNEDYVCSQITMNNLTFKIQ